MSYFSQCTYQGAHIYRISAMSLEVRQSIQIPLLQWSQSKRAADRFTCFQISLCFSIFHPIEIKTTLRRSSNASGADNFLIIFLALIVFSQEVIVSLQLSSASCPVLLCAHEAGALYKHSYKCEDPLFHSSATYYISFATLASSGVFITSTLK